MVKQIDIINQNLWWKHGKEFYKFDRDMREYEGAVVKFKRKSIKFKTGKIYIIRGPRRIGKSVWMKKMISELINSESTGIDSKKVIYFNCETLPSRSREGLRKVIKQFLDGITGENYIFLDEITHVQDWQIELKFLYDSGVLTESAVVVTGSLPSAIKEGTEYMPGRGIEENEYLIKPVHFREFISHINYELIFKGSEEKKIAAKKLISELASLNVTLEEDTEEIKKKFYKIYPFMDELRRLFDVYLLTGGFPKPVSNYFEHLRKGEKDIDNSLYEEIVNYILGDVTKVNKNRETARQILIAVSRRIGSKYSYTALSRELEEGIEHQTLISYIDILENSYILQTLPSYDFNKNMERVKGNKKVYFSDPFILYGTMSMVSGKGGFETTTKYLESEENKSKLVEGIVCTHLSGIKEIPKMKEAVTYLWFYYDRKGEVDFVYKTENDDYMGLELKYQYNVGGNIKKIDKIKNNIMLTYDTFDMTSGNIMVPAYLLLALLKSSEKNL